MIFRLRIKNKNFFFSLNLKAPAYFSVATDPKSLNKVLTNNVNNHKYFIPSPSSSNGSSSSSSSTNSATSTNSANSEKTPVGEYFKNERSSSPRKIQQQLTKNDTSQIVNNGFLKPQMVSYVNKEINQLFQLNKNKNNNNNNNTTSLITSPSQTSSISSNLSTIQPLEEIRVQRTVKTAAAAANTNNTENTQPITNSSNKPKNNISLNLNNDEALLGSKKAREAFLERLKFTENLKNNINKIVASTATKTKPTEQTTKTETNNKQNFDKAENSQQAVHILLNYNDIKKEKSTETNLKHSVSSASSNGFHNNKEITDNNNQKLNSAKPYDFKNNFSTVVKIDTKFKSEYFNEKNTIINSNNSYAQNVFESINDVLKNSPDLFVNNTTPTTANQNMHRENITNLLNRRNFLNQSKQGLTNQANIEKSTSFIEVTSTDQLKKTTTENSVTTS